MLNGEKGSRCCSNSDQPSLGQDCRETRLGMANHPDRSRILPSEPAFKQVDVLVHGGLRQARHRKSPPNGMPQARVFRSGFRRSFELIFRHTVIV